MRSANIDEQAFFDAIMADRSDDTPRLVYADWLDDHNQPERAEFIRLSIHLNRTYGFELLEGERVPEELYLRYVDLRTWMLYNDNNRPNLYDVDYRYVRGFIGCLFGTWDTIQQQYWMHWHRWPIELVSPSRVIPSHSIVRAISKKTPVYWFFRRCFYNSRQESFRNNHIAPIVYDLIEAPEYIDIRANQQIKHFKTSKDALLALSKACIKYLDSINGNDRLEALVRLGAFTRDQIREMR